MSFQGLARRALRNDFIRHGVLVFGALMFANVLSYIFNFAISRRIGVEAYAALASLANGVAILSIPSVIVNPIVVKYTAEFHAVEDRARVWLLAQRLLKVLGIGALVLLAIGMLLRGVAASYLHIPNDLAVVLTLAIICIILISGSMRAVLQGVQDFRGSSTSIGLEALLKAAIAIALVYGLHAGVTAAMFGWFIATLSALAYTVWVIGKHRVPNADQSQLSFDLRRLVRTSTVVGLAMAALTMLGFMDVPLVKHYFSPHEAGLYAAANLTGKVVFFLVSFLPAVLLPKAVAQVQRGESPLHLLAQAGGTTIIMAGGVLAVFGAMPGTIVRLLAGSAFAAAAPYVFQYDLAMGLLALLTLIVYYRVALHRFGFLYPLGLVLTCEIGAIALFHQSLWNIVHIVLISNAVMCAASVVGLARPVAAIAEQLPNSAQANAT